MSIRNESERTSISEGPANASATQDSLSYKAYTQLEEMIVTLKLGPGATVSEAALSKQLNIGRTPIREALQRLAREGLVVVLPRRGVLVSDINVKTQLKLLEVRREVERLIARTAARRATDAERSRFKEIAEGFEDAARHNDDTRFMRLDHEFNNLELVSARNPFAASTMGLMSGLSRRFWYVHYVQVGDLPQAAKLHAQVAKAIAGKDESGAAEASDQLIDYLENFSRATFDLDVA